VEFSSSLLFIHFTASYTVQYIQYGTYVIGDDDDDDDDDDELEMKMKILLVIVSIQYD
jgi:hypothetical protein